MANYLLPVLSALRKRRDIDFGSPKCWCYINCHLFDSNRIAASPPCCALAADIATAIASTIIPIAPPAYA